MQKAVITGMVFSGFLLLFATSAGIAQTRTLVHLSDVKTIYVDNSAFKIVSSSCGQRAGGYYLPCAKYGPQRAVFLVALKRWLGKSGFTVVDNKDDAEAILDGTLAIQDNIRRNGTYGPAESVNTKHRGDPDKLPSLDEVPSEYRSALFEPQWTVTAWLTNQNTRKIWTLGSWYPGISYSGSKSKAEGKKLAKAIEYDFKHHR
jgi:hypothetical protein